MAKRVSYTRSAAAKSTGGKRGKPKALRDPFAMPAKAGSSKKRGRSGGGS